MIYEHLLVSGNARSRFLSQLSCDQGTEAVDSIQSIVELYRIWLITIAWTTASPEPRVLICMQAKLL